MFETRGVRREAERVMKSLEGILKAGGSAFSNALKTGIFLTRFTDSNLINQMYERFFDGDFPARETLGVARQP